MAVVVTASDRPPGATEWLAASLRGLAEQDYPDLRVVVVDTAVNGGDPTARVRTILPQATVHQAPDDVGFGAAANVVLTDDSHEIRFFLFCHDDAIPEPGTVRALVDAALRCDAEVVGPKLVCGDDPHRLSQVGVAVTRTGVALPMVEPGELDQGQQDTVLEVFAVPGAFTLVRADLFSHVGGFDESISFLADDLSLCWRARIAGARVVLEPAARVRHHAALGHRIPLTVRRRLLARHRLRVVLTSYSRGQLVRVVPQAALASLVEGLVGVVTLRPSRTVAALGAWWWNLRRPRSLWDARRQVRAFRRMDDSSLRPLQVPGAVRPQLALRRYETEPEAAAATGPASGAAPGPATPSEEAASAGPPAGPAHPAGAHPVPGPKSLADRVEALRAGWTSGGVLVLLALVGVLLTGSRHLLTRGIPAIGDLAPFEPPGDLVDRWVQGWRAPGAFETPAPTALGLLGSLGALAGGSMGLARTLLTLGLIPLGVAGAFRLLRPTGSPRAPIAAAVAYAVLPVPYTALSEGRWASLAAYAAAPWLLGLLAGAGGAVPFGDDALATRVVRVAAVTGLLAALVPVASLLVVLVAGALVLGSLLAGEVRGLGRLVGAALGGALLGVALHLPWAIAGVTSVVSGEAPGSLSSPVRGGWWLGLGATTAGPHDLLTGTMDLGAGSTSLATRSLWWALPAAAALVLLVGRSWRLAWGIRAWTVAGAGWAGAQAIGWVAGRQASDIALPHPDMLLAVAGAGLALAVGMGVVAVEHDLAGRGRSLVPRLAAGLAGLALMAAAVPLVEAALDGSWHMPRRDLRAALGFVDRDVAPDGGQLLWVGDQSLLPLPGRLVEGDVTTSGAPAIGDADDQALVAYATSRGLPRATDLWRDPAEVAPAPIAEALRLALTRQTTRLGRLLALHDVEYVAMPRSLGPAPATRSRQAPTPQLAAMLAGQLDLQRVDVDPGLVLYRNTAPRAAWSGSGAKGSGTPDDAAATGDRSAAVVVVAGHTLTVTSLGRTLLIGLQAGLWLAVVGLALRRLPGPGRRVPVGSVVPVPEPMMVLAEPIPIDVSDEQVRLLRPPAVAALDGDGNGDGGEAAPRPATAVGAGNGSSGAPSAPGDDEVEGVRVLSRGGAP